jgi:hypothetical protein
MPAEEMDAGVAAAERHGRGIHRSKMKEDKR